MSKPKFAPITQGSVFLGLSVVVLLILCAGHPPLRGHSPGNTQSPFQGTSEWERYTVEDRDFSVLLPATPAMSSYDSKNGRPKQTYLRNIVGAYSQGIVYAVYVFERKQSFEQFIKVLKFSSPTEFKRDVFIAGVKGKEYAFQNDSVKAVTQYFDLYPYVYIFSAHGSLLGNPDVGISRFFDSIRFESPKRGVAIAEGAGPSPDSSRPDANVQIPVYSIEEVTRKAIPVIKPIPTYTDEAREKGITGTVSFECVLTSSGEVINFRLISGLPHGITEKAIAAARQLKFLPAIKDGRFVSVRVKLEYNFNLY